MKQVKMPEAVQMRALDALLPYARNARTHSDAQVAQIAASMVEFGWTNPVLVDGVGTIIAGHGRVLAARKLGLVEVPCIVLSHLTDAQRRALVIADNRLALSAGWDDEMLASELIGLRDDGFSLPLLGFGDDEIGRLLAVQTEGLTDPDDVPEEQAEAVSQAGDLWVMGRHRLICGDSTDAGSIAVLLAGVKPKLMVTDPPYGVEYDPQWRIGAGLTGKEAAVGKVLNDDKASWRGAYALFPGDIAYVWHASRFASVVEADLHALGFGVRAQIIWAKSVLVISRGAYHWQHEPCWYAVREKNTAAWSGDRKQSTLWRLPLKQSDGVPVEALEDSGVGAQPIEHDGQQGFFVRSTLWPLEHRRSETGHGTQKPVEAMRRPMVNHACKAGVYDPFSGSGTTIIAGEIAGRAVYAVELNPVYVDVAVRRWQQFTGLDAVLEGDGRTFAEVAASRTGVHD